METLILYKTWSCFEIFKDPSSAAGGDLSHKGRGESIPIAYHSFNWTDRKVSWIKNTSPLVGEVARRAGEGYLHIQLAESRTDGHNHVI